MAYLFDTGIFATVGSDSSVMSGAKLYFYAAGTTTPLDTYTSIDLDSLSKNTNPVVADADGRFPPIWMVDALYKVKLTTSLGIVIETRDDVGNTSILSLASTTAPSGASLIGNLGGGTVQDAIFVEGPSAAAVSTTARVDWKREPEGTSYPVASVAGSLWSDKVSYSHAISADFNAVNAPVNSPLSSPAATLLLVSQNTGSDAIVLPLQTIGGVHVSGKEATAGNFIVYSAAGLTNVKMKGIEVDFQPGAGTTISEGFGLALNAFTSQCPGSAIYIEGIFGGSWGTGISMGNLSSIGAGLGPAVGNPSMGTLVDTGTAQYQIDAIKLNNGHKVRWQGTASVHAKQYMDGSNNLRIVTGTGSLLVRDNTDAVSLLTVRASGPQGIVDISTSSGEYHVNGTKVVGARDTGWVAMTGTPDKTTALATDTATLQQVARRMKYIQDVLSAHGLIGA